VRRTKKKREGQGGLRGTEIWEKDREVRRRTERKREQRRGGGKDRQMERRTEKRRVGQKG